jgi:transposase
VEVEASPTCRTLQRMTRLHADCVEERSRWLNRIRGLLNQIFPELERLLKDFNTKTARCLLQAYPTPMEIAQAPLSELTTLLIKASHGTRREAFARALQQAAQHSVGLDDLGLRLELGFALRQLDALTTMTRELEQEVSRLTQQLLAEYSAILGLEQPLTLDSFPCGSALTIGALLAEMGAVERFPSLKQLVSYFGWCPQTHESGTLSNPHPQLSQRGNRFARRTLWMLALLAIRWVEEYRDYFQARVKQGKNKMKTVVAVGRKLLGVFFAILRTGQAYDPKRYLSNCLLTAI